jgi:hypothetical protein
MEKMVDGKGGNLKTIHHYKTERVVFVTTPPFRLYLVHKSFHGAIAGEPFRMFTALPYFSKSDAN